MKAFKYKLKTKKRPDLTAKLEQTLELCRELHNAAVQERRDADQINGLSLDLSSQKKQLPEIKELRPDLAAVHAQVLQDVLIRVDKSFNNFFRRVKEGVKKPGYPRFKGRDRYDSFTSPQAGGFTVSGNKLTLSKIGALRFRQSRPIDGTVKTCTIKREAGDWFVIFTVETASQAPLAKTNQKVGLDVGLEKFAALSNGETIANPRFYKTAEAEIAAAAQNLSRKRIGSHNRRKAKIKLEVKKKPSSYCFLKFGRTGRSRSNPAKESPPTDRLRA